MYENVDVEPNADTGGKDYIPSAKVFQVTENGVGYLHS